MLCRIPYGPLVTAGGTHIFCVGGILCDACPPPLDAEEGEEDEVLGLVEKLATSSSPRHLLPPLHDAISSRHASSLGCLWVSPRAPRLLRETCTTPCGSLTWQALLLHGRPSDGVGLLSACLDDSPAWSTDPEACRFLLCALQHAHPAASHALGRRILDALRRGKLDTRSPCVADILLHLCRLQAPGISQALRLAPETALRDLFHSEGREKLLKELAQLGGAGSDLTEYVQLWL